jgi:hypothetical protein
VFSLAQVTFRGLEPAPTPQQKKTQKENWRGPHAPPPICSYIQSNPLAEAEFDTAGGARTPWCCPPSLRVQLLRASETAAATALGDRGWSLARPSACGRHVRLALARKLDAARTSPVAGSVPDRQGLRTRGAGKTSRSDARTHAHTHTQVPDSRPLRTRWHRKASERLTKKMHLKRNAAATCLATRSRREDHRARRAKYNSPLHIELASVASAVVRLASFTDRTASSASPRAGARRRSTTPASPGTRARPSLRRTRRARRPRRTRPRPP